MKQVLKAFDRFLKERGLEFRGTIIGGAALIVMGVIERATEDVDCLEPTLPKEIKSAAEEFRTEYKGEGAPLKEEWLNNGPASLMRDLPSGWKGVENRFSGARR